MKTIIVTLRSKKGKAMGIEPGEKIPEEAGMMIRTYQIEMPDEDYEKLNREAKAEGITINEKIISTYEYADKLPSRWKII